MKTALNLLIIILFPFIIGISMSEGDSAAIQITEDFNPDRLDGAFTGGFGEQTCHSCHFDYDINMDGGSLTFQGVDDVYETGKNYKITVTVRSERLEVGGFQLTSRYKDGSQAGQFEWSGDRLMLTPSISDEIQYLQHSAEGTTPTSENEVSWIFTWQAPDDSRPVKFNLAANAGNLDDSSFGDWIYVEEMVISPR